MSIVKGRSICPKCKQQLAWYDNVPVLSFALLKGKCRQCKKPISWQYPVVELITGLAFVAMTVKWLTSVIPANAGIWGPRFLDKPGMTTVALASLLFITSCLVLVALHDQKTTYVLSAYVYAAIAATLIYLLATYTGSWNLQEVGLYLLPNILASVVAMIPFALLYFFSKGAWMGAGDIEIAALLGFLVGWPNFLVALYFAFIVGSIWGLAKVYFLKNAKMKSEIPFAPFLIAGTIFAFLFAEQVISLYVKIFLG
jgi:prepilin signal peptidase PulO-like enzyme (type II secretory pathway)